MIVPPGQGKGNSLRIPKISKRTYGFAVSIVTLGLCSYFVRELLVSLALFSLAFLCLALSVFAAIILWWVGEKMAYRAGLASRKVIAFSRRLIAAYPKP